MDREVNMTVTEELQQVGLCDETSQPHLTNKGREWLRLLGELESLEVVDLGEANADFVLSTSGIFR
ncbi:MAG: hypothetical protein QOF16_554 [Actinomycetota bacterium]|jgi:hypothetical protein|nr:hypothetical protein [Actinomycetota bacterium]MEA2486900.1 hypothetical protein [Actinomycetota bacterium]